MPEKLEPCPLCDSPNITFERGNARVSTKYRCDDCGCFLETGETWQAPERWNTRIAHTQQDRIAKLEAALGLILSWWPKGSEHSRQARDKGSSFIRDLIDARATLTEGQAHE